MGGLVDAAYVRLRPHWAAPDWDGPLTEAQAARLRRHLLAFGMAEAQADFYVRLMCLPGGWACGSCGTSFEQRPEMPADAVGCPECGVGTLAAPGANLPDDG